MTSKSQIIGKISSQKPFLEEKFFVREIGIFGSVAREEQNSKSDIDILVDLKEPIGIFDFIRLEDYLSKLLDSRVDLVTKTGLKSLIKEEILSQTIYV